MLEKRGYGIVCTECKYPFQLGFEWLEKGAQLEQLRSQVSARGGLVSSDRCPREECRADTQVALGKLIFLDGTSWVLEPGADDLSRE
jgi:hypothetical protein